MLCELVQALVVAVAAASRLDHRTMPWHHPRLSGSLQAAPKMYARSTDLATFVVFRYIHLGTAVWPIRVSYFDPEMGLYCSAVRLVMLQYQFGGLARSMLQKFHVHTEVTENRNYDKLT